MTKEFLLDLLEKELNHITERRFYYRNEFMVTDIEQVVELNYNMETLETKFRLVKQAMEILNKAEIKEGPTFIHTYINKKRYLKFIDNMVRTIEELGIEIPKEIMK